MRKQNSPRMARFGTALRLLSGSKNMLGLKRKPDQHTYNANGFKQPRDLCTEGSK